MTTRKPFFTDKEAQDLFKKTSDKTAYSDSSPAFIKYQAMATFALADRVSEVNDTFNRIADSLEALLAKGANDHEETIEVLKAVKDNTSSVVKKTHHFSQKN